MTDRQLAEPRGDDVSGASQRHESLFAARVYHPDPEINEEIIEQARQAEIADLAAGYPPRYWLCPGCDRGHKRGHFQVIGVHRCMNCGYVGTGGTTHTKDSEGRMIV